MNCEDYCNTHGCNQGKNCPVRRSCELPVDQVKRPAPYRVSDFLVSVALVAAISAVLACLGPALDDLDAKQRTTQAAIDAQTQADLDWHRDMAAAALCRSQHGESLIRWTEAGELVCIPRGYIRRKSQIASNP